MRSQRAAACVRLPAEAAALIAEAQNRFEQETPDYELALLGDDSGAGFLEVIERYGATPAGNLAKHYAGICYRRRAAAIRTKIRNYSQCTRPCRGFFVTLPHCLI